MSQDPSWSGELSDPVVVDEVGSLSESLVTRKPQRGQLLTGDVLAEVARVYREAWKDDKPTNEAVRKAFHLSKDGAAKRIGKARRAGLLDGIGPKR